MTQQFMSEDPKRINYISGTKGKTVDGFEFDHDHGREAFALKFTDGTYMVFTSDTPILTDEELYEDMALGLRLISIEEHEEIKRKYDEVYNAQRLSAEHSAFRRLVEKFGLEALMSDEPLKWPSDT